jgi:ribosomal protein L7/L12
VNIKPVIDKEDFDCVVKDLMLFLQKEGSCCLIDAIKMYRILTGTGLKEAKEAVISIWESKYNKSVKITDVH